MSDQLGRYDGSNSYDGMIGLLDIKVKVKKPVQYMSTLVSGVSQAKYSAPVRFRPVSLKKKPKNQAEPNQKARKRSALFSSYNVTPSPNNLAFLPNWIQLLKTWKTSPIIRLELMYFVKLAGISLDKTDLEDRNLIAECLQTPHEEETKNNTGSPSSNNHCINTNIFPLLEEATIAYFRYSNPFNPFFSHAGFLSRPRSSFLRLCIWRVGLQFLSSSELLLDLCNNIDKQILSRLVPSAISFELGTLQGILILIIDLYSTCSNKYQEYLFNCACLISRCLGLHLVIPGPLNQERLLTLFVLKYSKVRFANVFMMAWHTNLPEFPLTSPAWPNKAYSNAGDLYRDHPNNHQSSFFHTDSFSATLDANIATLCLCTYHFERAKYLYKLRSDLKNRLKQILAWGTCELQRSKIIQLPNQQLVPLANCHQVQPLSMVFNYPETNAVIAQLQHVLLIRFHYILLSVSEPHHVFCLIDLLKLVSSPSSLFSRIDMLLDATKLLLLMPRDSKVKHYLDLIRNCLENMQGIEEDRYHAKIYLQLFNSLLSRAKIVSPNV